MVGHLSPWETGISHRLALAEPGREQATEFQVQAVKVSWKSLFLSGKEPPYAPEACDCGSSSANSDLSLLAF